MRHLVRVVAPSSTSAYLPHFAAEALGFFADEGLSIQMKDLGRGAGTISALRSGEADIALGGIWRPVMYREHDEHLVSFAQLCGRCPMAVVSRNDHDLLDLATTARRPIVLIPDGSPSLWLLLRWILRELGAEDNSVRVIHLNAHEASSMFVAGSGDFYLAEPPTLETFEAQGYRTVLDLARVGGRLPWSVYFSTDEFVRENASVIRSFSRAIERGMDWIRPTRLSDATDVLLRKRPGSSRSVLAASISSCLSRSIWSGTRIEEESLERWQHMLVDGGLLSREQPYANLVRIVD